MITYKLHLIRTGKTSSGPWERYVGQADLPLSPQGTGDLQALCSTMEYPKVEKVFTSPLLRCRQTAELLYPNTYTVTLDGLKDMSLGTFEGKKPQELSGQADYAAWLENSFENPPPGGEPAEAFTRRIVGAVSHIFAAMMEERMTNVAVVTHAGVIMTLLAAIGLPKAALQEWMTANGTGYTLLLTPQMWMRDKAVEVFARLPVPLQEDEGWV